MYLCVVCMYGKRRREPARHPHRSLLTHHHNNNSSTPSFSQSVTHPPPDLIDLEGGVGGVGGIEGVDAGGRHVHAGDFAFCVFVFVFWGRGGC